MSQPEHFVEKGKENLVCMLKKSLYGLKQSPRMWYKTFETYVLSLRFLRFNHCVYFKSENDRILFIVIYVDDMLLIGNGICMILDFKSYLSTH